MNSYNRRRSVTILLLDVVFFARTLLRFQQKAPHLTEGQWSCELKWPARGAACHTRALQTLHSLTLLQHEGLLVLQGSQGSPSTAGSCERNSRSLSFALIICLKLGNSEGWGIFFILMHKESLRTGKLFLWLSLMPLLLMGVQREEKCNFRNIGMLLQNGWGRLYFTILCDRRQWVLLYFILWLNLVCPTWCKININWVLVWSTLFSKHRKNQTHKCWKRKRHLIKS